VVEDVIIKVRFCSLLEYYLVLTTLAPGLETR
jgi:hypothetical protein